MFRWRGKIVIVLADILSFNASLLLTYWTRFHSGIFTGSAHVDIFNYIQPSLIISGLWIIIFLFGGLYKEWYAESRIDELVVVVKSVIVGVFLLFFITFDLNQPINFNRIILVIYCFSLLVTVSFARLMVRSIQRYLLIKGIGRKPTLIVGFNKNGRKLMNDVKAYPALGFEVEGFIDKETQRVNSEYSGITVLGDYKDLTSIIKERGIQELLIAIKPSSHEEILEVVSFCEGVTINFNVVPDLYDILSGHVKTNAIYGFPLMKILPEFMPPWERNLKRLIDILFSCLVLTLFSPLWIAIGIVIKLDSKGPVLYAQTRLGRKKGKFTIYKFRSMVHNAEEETGPVWATSHDERITRVGKLLRKARLDEIPQFINILIGNMSLVGPRPERPFFVEQLEKEIPIYSKRFNVKPGLTGLAQTKHHYDASLDDVREKVKYDLYYIENISMNLDLKIVIRTIGVVFTGSGAR